ncbi:MAG: hypothetical protein HY329_08920 [Chloroflexi bacterium]|nr:hypothetical protein [Chloroflexota bacterium]
MVAWRLVDDGAHPGRANMARDEAILTTFAPGDVPVLRLYSWERPCVSIGYFQPLDVLDLDACDRLGVEWVRRATGGRAVLHDLELTYCLVAGLDDPIVGGGLANSYRRIAAGLAAGLAMLGLVAAIAGRGDSRWPSRQLARNPACYGTPAQFELTTSRGKLIGSAQLRRGARFLQHGAIPLANGPVSLVNVLRSGDAAESRTTLADALARRVLAAEVVAAMRIGFEQELGVTFVDDSLAPAELAAAATIFRDQYDDADWLARR